MNHPLTSTPGTSSPLDVPGLIRRVRRIADLSQRELAAALDVNQATVARWEGGLSVPDVLIFARLLGLADFELSVVDAEGHEPEPMGYDRPRDRQNRRFAAHLDLVDERHPVTWELRPTAPRRARRDVRRAREGWSFDHPTMAEFGRERRRAKDARGALALERARERMRLRSLTHPEEVRWDALPPCTCPITCEDQPGCLANCPCSCEPIGERFMIGTHAEPG